MRRPLLRTGVLCGLLAAVAASGGQALAQSVPSTAQAIAIDQRQGNVAVVNGLRVFYQVAGSGQPLVLIHGYPLNGQLFTHQLAQLSARFRVVVLDLPGFGKSGPVPASETVGGYAGVVLGLMDQLGLQSAIIGGHSMGGQIMLSLYSQAPARVAGLILIDTNPEAAMAEEMAQWPGFGRQAQQNGVASTVPAIDAQMLTGDLRLRNDPPAVQMIDILAEASVSGMVGGGHALASRPDFSGLLAGITVPTLIVEGIDDPVYGVPVAQMAHAAIPGSRLALIETAEHAAVFERYGAVDAAIVNWWDSTGRR